MSIPKGLKLDDNGNALPLFVMPKTASTLKVDGTSASAKTAAVIHATDEVVISVAADSDCYLLAAADPTALNDGTCIKQYAKTVQTYIIPPACKLAVIGGIIYITPMP